MRTAGPFCSPYSGSGNKYKYDSKTGLFKLSRILPSGMHFPCDFGFIPGTVSGATRWMSR